ncbi:MAG: ArdC-like ssDNA-binding domain-containing protein, partial [Acidimicrobiales bacterium]
MSDERAGRLALEEAHEAMVVAVEAIRSGEDWQLMLSVAARLHTYSAGNVALLMAQAIERGWDPAELGPLGGYRTLQALGYQVRRGERGLVVLAPVIARARGLLEGEANGDRDRDRAVLRGFRLAHVFDVAHQADGPPLPEGPRPILLEGASPEGLAEGLAAQLGAAGFVLLRAPLSSANGRTDFGARTVTVADRLSPAATTKTLA